MMDLFKLLISTYAKANNESVNYFRELILITAEMNQAVANCKSILDYYNFLVTPDTSTKFIFPIGDKARLAMITVNINMYVKSAQTFYNKMGLFVMTSEQLRIYDKEWRIHRYPSPQAVAKEASPEGRGIFDAFASAQECILDRRHHVEHRENEEVLNRMKSIIEIATIDDQDALIHTFVQDYHKIAISLTEIHKILFKLKCGYLDT